MARQGMVPPSPLVVTSAGRLLGVDEGEWVQIRNNQTTSLRSPAKLHGITADGTAAIGGDMGDVVYAMIFDPYDTDTMRWVGFDSVSGHLVSNVTAPWTLRNAHWAP